MFLINIPRVCFGMFWHEAVTAVTVAYAIHSVQITSIPRLFGDGLSNIFPEQCSCEPGSPSALLRIEGGSTSIIISAERSNILDKTKPPPIYAGNVADVADVAEMGKTNNDYNHIVRMAETIETLLSHHYNVGHIFNVNCLICIHINQSDAFKMQCTRCQRQKDNLG